MHNQPTRSAGKSRTGTMVRMWHVSKALYTLNTLNTLNTARMSSTREVKSTDTSRALSRSRYRCQMSSQG